MVLTPVTLLCGFLGSGKTTLLRHALERSALSDALVIVNEFGEVSIDHLVVADLTENILELRNGCLCCTIRGDLAMTLRDVFRRRQLGEIKHFDQVIVEASGLADPIPLAHTLMANPPVMQAFRLDAIVSVVDAHVGMTTIANHATALSQVALADLIVISKTDIATADAIAGVRARVESINPGAEIQFAALGDLDSSKVFGRRLFNPETRSEAINQWLARKPGHDHGSDYASHAIVYDGTLSLAGTSVFLNHVVNEKREQILRIKALAGFRERDGAPALLHAVQEKFYPVSWLADWPSADHTSRLIFIGRDLDREWLDTKFHSLCV